jgi:D-aminopeptidase
MRKAEIAWLLVIILAAVSHGQSRPRARELELAPGAGSPGALNAITDVAGVAVGHVTVVQGDTIRTGVTAVLPHGGNLFREKVPGAVFVGNAFGKLAGSTQVDELGTIETPIVLTSTLSVGTAIEGVVRWTLAQPGSDAVRSVNALVEANDSTLATSAACVTRDDVVSAIVRRAGPVERHRRGRHRHDRVRLAGSERRRLVRGPARASPWLVGDTRAANHGGRLTISGVCRPGANGRRALHRLRQDPISGADGSCMIVVATDAPLDARDRKRRGAGSSRSRARAPPTRTGRRLRSPSRRIR